MEKDPQDDEEAILNESIIGMSHSGNLADILNLQYFISIY